MGKALDEIRPTPIRVLDTLAAIRASGLTNMFSRKSVTDLAFELDYWSGYWLALRYKRYDLVLSDFTDYLERLNNV